jgi:hypothetical protein
MILPVRRHDQILSPIGQYGHPAVRFGATPVQTGPIPPMAPARQAESDDAPDLKEDGVLG